MTVYSYWQQTLDMPAVALRQMSSLWWSDVDGIRRDSSDPLLVQPQGTPSMLLTVNGGWAKKSGYLGFVSAPTNVTITTADPALPRIDLVILRWLDTENGDASSIADLEVIKGSPNASPAAPSTVGMTVQILAQVYVAAGTTAISSGAITDKRTLVNSRRSPRAKAVFYGAKAIASNDVTTVMNAWSNATPTLHTSGMSVTSTGIVVAEDGDYDILATAAFAANGSGRRGILLTVNGAEPDHVERTIISASSDGAVTPNVATLVTLSDGDRISFVPYQSSGGSLNLAVATLVVALRG